jgi:putative membrane protein
LPPSDERIDVMIGKLRLLAPIVMWPVAVLARSGDANYMDSDHMNGYEHMMGPWGGGVLMWLLLLILVGVLIYILVRGLGPGGFGQAPRETALDILKKRYARGEITKEQFDEMKKDL